MKPDKISLLVKKINALKDDPKIKHNSDMFKIACRYVQLAEKTSSKLFNQGYWESAIIIQTAVCIFSREHLEDN